jgi:hypothetical protein
MSPAATRIVSALGRVRGRSVLLYSAMVGVPLVLLLGVLGMGRDLSAPPSLGGAWRVESGATCGLSQGERFDIVQSGQFVVIRLSARSPLQGRLDGDVLRAAGGTREASAPGCGERELRLELRLMQSATVLEGTGGVEDCSACPPRPIRAVRSL